MSEIVSFIDFEASGLSDKSYPIEVAWSIYGGPIESYLISPAGIESWTDWDPVSEKVHGISRSDLLANGLAPPLICHRLTDLNAVPLKQPLRWLSICCVAKRRTGEHRKSILEGRKKWI